MPRGGEYDDGPTVASDNAIESGENKIAGVPKGDSDVRLAPPLRSPLALMPFSFPGTSLIRRRPLQQSCTTSRRH